MHVADEVCVCGSAYDFPVYMCSHACCLSGWCVRVMFSVRFLTRAMFCNKVKKLNFGLIRREHLPHVCRVSHMNNVPFNTVEKTQFQLFDSKWHNRFLPPQEDNVPTKCLTKPYF